MRGRKTRSSWSSVVAIGVFEKGLPTHLVNDTVGPGAVISAATPPRGRRGGLLIVIS